MLTRVFFVRVQIVFVRVYPHKKIDPHKAVSDPDKYARFGP